MLKPYHKPELQQVSTGSRLLILWLLLMGLPGLAQIAPQTLSGVVVDGITDQPIFRALVRLNSGTGQRAVLTDSSGHFSFAGVDPNQASLTVIKPGYTFTQSPNDPGQIRLRPEEALNPIQLKLYAKAILRGSISDPDGNPLGNIMVQPLRGIDDDSGRHWIPMGFARSDVHGRFRIQVAAGDYRLQTDISRTDGASAVMPISLPDSGDASFRLNPGDQRDLDLHPTISPLVTVSAHLNVTVEEISRLTAVFSDGTSFPVSFTSTGPSTLDARLPAGSYVLESRRRSRGTDALSQASLTLNASLKQPVTVSLQFVPIASIPIEVTLDDATVIASATSSQALNLPNARSLGLALEPTSPQSSTSSEYLHAASSRDDAATTFTAPPGTYRLRASRNYSWYITSALYGGADLLGRDFTIAAGSSPGPILLTISNQLSTLAGNVTVDGQPAACWIYLTATTPSVTSTLTLRSNDSGVFSQKIPPGTYRAVAFQTRHSADPQSLRQFTGTTITVAAASKASITLEATPNPESHP